MKILTCLAALVISCSASPIDDWLSFKQTHGKKYTNPSEEHFRKTVFFKNKKMIEEHNDKFEKGVVPFHMKINHYGDLTNEEFRALMDNKFNQTRRKLGSTFIAPENVLIPDAIDWRKNGAVTPVKDQGNCNSCWAFSTTGALEAQHFRKTGKLISLSEQNLIDCSKKYDNAGCFGGLMENAFNYINENGGVDTEDSYPYEARDGECRFRSTAIGARDSGHIEIPAGNEEALKKAVGTVGPISVAIDSGEDSFRFYSGGVYYDKNCCPENLIHAVLVVGYGSENGHDYWLVKNSWNSKWGEDGYVKIARNKNNHCGIASKAIFPLV